MYFELRNQMSFMSCKLNVCFDTMRQTSKPEGVICGLQVRILEKEFYVLNISQIFPAMKDQLIAQF